MENRLEGGRAGLALVTAGILILAMFALYANSPARADHANEAVYEFNFVNGSTLSGAHGPGGEAPIPFSFFEDFYGEGNVPDGFEGLTIHVSCSDVFTDGWSDDSGSFPDESIHEDWQIANYSIVRHTNGNTSPCEEVFVTTTTVEETTTTVEETTTTVEDTTTTVEETTTTTEATTTTVEDEVLGTVVTTTTEAPTTTVEDEVAGTHVLPFTGIESDQMAMLAMALLGGGILTLVGSQSIRHRREE